MSYKDLVKEIKEIQALIGRYNNGEDVPSDFNYKRALSRLSYLRNRKRQLPRSDQNHKQFLDDDVDLD